MAIKVTKILPEFIDERGSITRIIDQDKYPLRAVLYITGGKGSIRGNHYHKKDVHYVYCLSGKFRYSEKGLKKNAKKESVIIYPGELVLSPQGKIHSMEFLEDSVMLSFTSEPREQEKYERDTIRIKIA